MKWLNTTQRGLSHGLGVQTSKMGLTALKSRCWQAGFLPGGSGVSPSSGKHPRPPACGPFLHLHGQQHLAESLACWPLSGPLLPLPLLRTPVLPATHQTPQGHLPTSGSADSTPPQPWGPGPRGSGRTRLGLERRVAGGRSSSLRWHRDAIGPAPHPGAQQRKARWGPASEKVYAQRTKARGGV